MRCSSVRHIEMLGGAVVCLVLEQIQDSCRNRTNAGVPDGLIIPMRESIDMSIATG